MRIFPVVCLCFVVFFGFTYLHFERQEDQTKSNTAIRAIVGEAADQGFECMRYVAHAIRNRNSFHGVYGINAAHNDYESDSTWAAAEAAWIVSKNEADPTLGSNSWGTWDDLTKLHEEDYVANCRELYFYKTNQQRSSTKGRSK